MSLWWRAYSEAVDNPKLIGLTDEQHRFWFNILCVYSAFDGNFPDVRTIAIKLRMQPRRVVRLLNDLRSSGLIDGEKPHNWDKRQYKSDTSTPRVKRFRNKQRNVSETPQRNVSVTAPENRDREQISVAKATAAAAADGQLFEPVGEDSRAKLFRLGKTILVSFGIAERRTGGLIGQWLKAQDDPDGLLAVLQFARDRNVAEPVAYVSAVIHGKPANGAANGFDRRPGESLGQLCTRLAAEARKLEAAAGFGRPDDAVRSH